MLLWLPQDDLGETEETFLALNLGGDVQKPFVNRGGQGCRIILD